MNATAFLTGGTGFVGANLARTLLADGWRVRALARPGSDPRNLCDLPLEIVEGDLTDADLARKIAGADAVFHVAAHYSLFRADERALMRSNVAGTRNVLRAARNAGVRRTVYTSSVAAIGVKRGAVADETYQSPPLRLTGPYKLSKYLAEQEAVDAARAGQDVVIVNPTTPLGAWDRKPTPTGDMLFVRFLNGAMPAYVDTGLNFVDVRDVARGHVLAYDKGRAGERYILGSENLSLHSLFERVGAQSGRRPPRIALPYWLPLPLAWFDERVLARTGRRPQIAIDGVRMSRESMYYSSSKAMKQLGYDPKPIDAAIGDAIRWFADNGYLSKRS